ncbi:MAG: tRNA lysidine(34) synthetase TilS [Muribaculaceae bacterium]|nr:tRNA lysidine(34) synthetase TilS [Muribaculaceae bacterium]
MNSFEQRVSDFIAREIKTDPRKGKIIVALSGGADSVALLAAMVALGYDCVAAHCNFHLRGEESDRDMAHARLIAEKLGVPLELTDFDVEARMAATGESMEMACRELRYDRFAELKKAYQAQAVATGHHLEDNVETMLMNMLRGAGVRGASGISPRGSRRISPLLEMTKREILDYMVDKELTYVTDSSNLSCDISRNRLRHGALELLEHDFPGAMQRLGRSLGNLREDVRLMDAAVGEWRRKYIAGDRLLTHSLRGQEDGEGILFAMLKPLGFKRDQTDAILTAPPGSRFIAGDRMIVINRTYALLQEAESGPMEPIKLYSLTDPNPYFTAELIDPEDFAPVRDNGTIYFDLDKLPEGAVWELRAWAEGDRMEPFGMKGRSKLISDIFNDAKVESKAKATTPVLTCNGTIVWLPGLRAGNHFKVDSKTTRIVCLKMIKTQA